MAARSACWNEFSSRGDSFRATPKTPARRVSPRSSAPATKLVWIETPTNPLLQIVDIAAIAEVAHDLGAVLAVDNTFASPFLQRPIELGADLVVHSTTKYLGGHSDVIGGAVDRLPRLARADRLLPECRRRLSPGLLIRGWCCAESRRWRCEWNAIAPTRGCSRRGWPGILGSSDVYYPGLADHPNHEVARRQMRDFGGMISVQLKGGAPAAQQLLTRTRLFSLAESLGGVESLIGHPATHDAREHPGRGPGRARN